MFTPNTSNNPNLVRDCVHGTTRRSLFKLLLQENDDDLNQDDDDFNQDDDDFNQDDDDLNQDDDDFNQDDDDFNPDDDNSQQGDDVQEDDDASQVNFLFTVRQFKEKVLGNKPEFRKQVITAELPSIHAYS